MNESIKMEQLIASKLPTYPEDDSIILEYVALRKKPFDYVCKSLVVMEEPKCVQDCPVSIMSMRTATSCPDYLLQPVMMCRDPFRKGRCKLVLCDVVSPDQETIAAKSSRDKCKEEMESKFKNDEVWIGFEQEYTIVDNNGVPYEWDMVCQDPASGIYSGLFRGRLVGEQRHLADTHLRACLYAGLSMYGCQRECHISMWEFQIGPTLAVDCVDQLHVSRHLFELSRFILMRLCEMMKVCVNLDIPVCATQIGFNRGGLHVNFSTKNMRAPGGIKHIHAAIDNLDTVPQEKLFKYYDSVDGANAQARLSGIPGTPYVDKFLVALGNKDRCSIRIPAHVARAGRGYFEDRRVGPDADPYNAARMLTIAALSPSVVE